MTRIFALLLFAISLFANPVIQKFDNTFANASQAVKSKLHNELKKLYATSIIKNDTSLQTQVLTRLAKSAKELGLNYVGYENDLKNLNKNSPQKEKTQQQNSTRYILSATKTQNSLTLKLSTPAQASDIKIHSLNQNGTYKNFIDIKGVLNGKSLTYNDFLADQIRIYQFDKQTTRVMFVSKKQGNLDAKISDNFLILSFKNFINKESVSQGVKKEQKQPKESPKFTTTYKKIEQKTIVIDPGHGGTDPGAINGKYQEKVAVLEISKKLGNELKKRGHKIYYTRSDDKFINLRARTKYANDKFADLFISVHANAAPNKEKAKSMQGVETFFLSPARSERSKNAAALENKSDIEEMNYFSQQTFLNFLNREKIIASNKLAIDIQRNVLSNIKKKYTSVSDGGVREAPFWVLVGALMPAILVEIGYITHPVEGPRLFESTYQDAMAKGIADGIEQYLKNNR
ncbi:N-acetylmuramoyl-L-alanine amidase [Campylobacter mucosalis CCUG 21559]|uniref:N-acetylmuramoyl-L-alanine amidase n=1 Tax=Campylobacter mucosalis CCUG 21559 TaxID=1032067 RepID=A0A6G5QIW9_9BACT|nr:N-acetylmuramoyl-L-alanine amidase [Campylobacter mucosalis]QCD45527.1 N-acetylmuramoyl-L-alanine amidase [Campylobacter mucosalis CCUG 21559]